MVLNNQQNRKGYCVLNMDYDIFSCEVYSQNCYLFIEILLYFKVIIMLTLQHQHINVDMIIYLTQNTGSNVYCCQNICQKLVLKLSPNNKWIFFNDLFIKTQVVEMGGSSLKVVYQSKLLNCESSLYQERSFEISVSGIIMIKMQEKLTNSKVRRCL